MLSTSMLLRKLRGRAAGREWEVGRRSAERFQRLGSPSICTKCFTTIFPGALLPDDGF